jgi:hypothetical protein
MKQKLLHPLCENLEYQDLKGMLKPRVHVDEFAAKMGDDDDVVVISFFVRDKAASQDLVNWFEKGYDWVLDADMSPGEIKPGRYLVYVEMRRRSTAGQRVAEMLDDLETLIEYSAKDWTMHYGGEDHPFSREEFDRLVPLSPTQYRKTKEKDLNEMRSAAGIDTVAVYDREDQDLRQLQSAAGI